MTGVKIGCAAPDLLFPARAAAEDDEDDAEDMDDPPDDDDGARVG